MEAVQTPGHAACGALGGGGGAVLRGASDRPIPDFLPAVGLRDDLVLVLSGLALVVKLTPPALRPARLCEADAGADKLPRLVRGAVAIVVLWLALLGGLLWWMIVPMMRSVA